MFESGIVFTQKSLNVIDILSSHSRRCRRHQETFSFVGDLLKFKGKKKNNV